MNKDRFVMNRKPLKINTIIKLLIILFAALIFLFPVYWMIVSSFKSNRILMKLPPQLYPTFKNLENYSSIFSESRYLVYIRNSVIVTTGTVSICFVVATLAGYSLSRYQFPFRKTLMSVLLSVQMFPVVAILISLFTFFTRMNLTNSYWGLILADVSMSLPLAVWMLKSFFDGVPRSLDESAKIDGCGRLRTMIQVIMPLIKPGLLAVGIYSFLNSWDGYLFALVIMNKNEMKTLPLGIVESFRGEYMDNYAGMMTMSLIVSLPIMLIFTVFQRYMVAGLTAGAVKE
jgi:multiple sugar transport system permease protein